MPEAQVYTARQTLECAQKRCIPCGYKIIVTGDADTVLNQRPELCPRFKAAQESVKPEFPLLDPALKILVVQDDSFGLTSIFKGYLKDMHQLAVTTAEPRVLVAKKTGDMAKRIKKLEAQGVKIHFEADLGALDTLGAFDRVLWDFFSADKVPDAFFESAARCLRPHGEIHLMSKVPPAALVEAAAQHELAHAGSFIFDRSFCPSYKVPYSDCNTVVLVRETDAANNSLTSDDTMVVSEAVVDEIKALLVKRDDEEVSTKKKKKEVKEKPTVDVPYEKEYFDLMNLKPKGKKHVLKRKMEYEARQEGKERPSKRVLPVRMEKGKPKKGW
ncbi:Aste57867_18495 [Aphanomyces stellatus]|uniref:Aste57867_18495 protein n=1 Tax=Aphanomyces stellatus TaxID=120398 RepID=A0A485LC21_9STRA|nr:hypothetical protein As57867_018433 [Aphanomyces stellatus]VFT95231.1 Aste57867_18495 [Aphanomyces stellatus]